MTTINEKEILEIETLKAKLSQVFHDTQMDFKRLEADQKRFDKKYEADQKRIEEERKIFDKNYDLEVSKKFYEALRLSFYGVAVGAGGTFAIAKTLQVLGAGTP